MSHMSPFDILSQGNELSNLFQGVDTQNADYQDPFEWNVSEIMNSTINLSSCSSYSDNQLRDNIPHKTPSLCLFLSST